ncbi:hypothetical protein M569_07359, partial [Genlisea aurea]
SRDGSGVKPGDEFDGDGYYMRRCVELAKKATGFTSPNPMVGCVIVKDGEIIGEGYHPKAGQPHAEVFAIRDAGEDAENGTAYVSLEPCNHYGRTPPCTEALIKAKLRRVVVGMVDPNPIVASKGVNRLRDAGIEVTVGVEEELCKRLNEAYIHRMLTGKPFVAMRYSMSLNGHLLNQISKEAMEFGGYYSKLLKEYDAVIISGEAFFSKASSLPVMSSEPGANQPLRIVLGVDKEELETEIPALSHNYSASEATIIISTKNSSVEYHRNAQQWFQILSLDRLSLLAILEHCNSRGLCSVLLDFRGESRVFEDVLKEGFEEKLFQKVIVEVLPILGDYQEAHLKVDAEVKNLRTTFLGQSVLLEGYI